MRACIDNIIGDKSKRGIMSTTSKTFKLSARRVATIGILTALSLLSFILESLLPPLFLPGAKIGLSNIFTLVTLFMFGPIDALILVVVRTTLGSLIVGNLVSLIYSLSAGVISLGVAILLVQFVYPKISMISISITSAIVHNIVQVLVFCLLVNNMYMISYLPYFALIGAASGLIVGALVYLVIHKVPLSFFEIIINNEKYIVKEKV